MQGVTGMIMCVVSPARHSSLNSQVRGDTSQCVLLTSSPGWEVLKAEGSLTSNWDLETSTDNLFDNAVF